MKLRINAKLRAAIIAAISVVGYTITSAQAADVTVLTTTFNVSGTGTDQWSLSGQAGAGYDLTTSGASLITIDSGALGNKNSGGVGTAQLNPNVNVQNPGPGWKLSFTVTNNGAEDVTIDSMTINSFLFSGGGAYQSSQTTRSFVLTMGPEGGTKEQAVTITGSGNNHPETGVIKWDFANAVTLSQGGSQTFSVQFAKGTEGLGCFVGLTSVVLSHTPTVSTATWNGTAEHHSWFDASSWDQAFHSGDVAVFGGSAAIKDVTVDQAVVAEDIRVTGGEYTLASQGADKTIATSKLNVASGASVTFTGAGATTISTLTGAGDLIAGAGSNVTLTSLSDFTGTYGVTGGGTLTVGFAINKDTFTVEHGTLNLGNKRHTINTLTIGDGGLVVAVGADNSDGCISGDIDIKAGGTFRMTGHHDAFGWGGNATKNIILTGESDTKRAELQFQQTTGNSATFKTNLKMMGHALVSTTKNGFNTYGGSIYAQGVDNTIQKFQLRSAATIEVAENGELTVGEMVYGADSTHNLTKTGAGTLTFTGTANMQALDLQDGSLVINGGTTTVAGDSTSTLNKTITVSAGSLVLRGTYEIGGNTGKMTTTYVGGEAEGVNGFEHVAGEAVVYTVAPEGATVNDDDATFTVGGEEVELVDGVYTTEGSTNYGVFYVKSGAESLDKALTYAGEHTVSTVSLANGTTINADHAGATIGLAMQGSATVNATAAGTISGVSGWSGNSLTITGGAEVSLMPRQDIVIGAGSSLLVNTDVAAQKIQLNGDGAHLTVGSEGELTLTNNLTLTKGVADVYGTMNVGHEVDLSNGSKATGTLHIYGTGSVTAKDGLWMAPSAAGILLEEDGTFAITGKSVKFTGKAGQGSIVASGSEVNYTADNTNARITNATMEALGNITIANQLVNVDVVTGAHTVSLNSAASSVIVSTGGTINFGTSGAANAISVQDGGIIGDYAKTGEGETTITSAGTAVLNSVIALQGGTLTMSGNYNIDALNGEITVTDYVDGAVKGNGFAVESGTVTVVNVAPEAQLVTTGGVFLRGGTAATMEGGVARVDTTNRSKFYVNSETENLTTAQAISPAAAVVLADGAKLVADANLTAGLSVAEGGHAYLQIEEGKLVQATVDAAVELSGSGTYALVSGVSTIGSTTLGEDWTGAIRLGGFSFSNTSLASFWREGSVVEMCGITGGYLEGWNNGDPVAANIRLTNPAEGNDGIAWKWNEGTTGTSEPTVTFTGDWDGSGTFQLTYRRQNVTFAGDISGWEGVFDYAGSYGTRLTFKDDADEINATILNNGTNNPENVQQQFHIIVENAATFNKSVSAYTLEVADGASATFNAAVAITTSITVGEDATLNMTAGGSIAEAITSAGTVSLTGVTLSDDFVAEYGGFAHYDVTGALAPELANYYGGTDGKYLTVVTGTGAANATGSGLVWGTQDNLAMDKGLVKVEDGGVIDYSAFYVTADTTTAEILAYAGEHAQELGWIVVDSGTLTLSEPLSDIYLMVSSNAAIAGAVTQEQMEGTLIGQGATATFEGVTELAPGTGNDYVTITSADSQTVAITNIGETDEIITYEGLAQDSAKVTADAVVVEAEREADVTIANALEVQSITNNSEHTLYLDGEVVTEALDAAAGDITLRSVAESVEVGSLTIGDHVAVGAYQGTDEEAAQEATVVISQTLTAGEESVLHANLELKDGATLNFNGTLTMTSELTVGTNLMLDETSSLYQELASFAEGSGRWVDLIMAGDDYALSYGTQGLSGANAADFFANGLFESGDYMIFATEESFGITRVPEPTTGTLSLLALMALAARRRRH